MARRAELVGIVRPEVDDQELDRQASKMEREFEGVANLTANIDTRQIQRKLEQAIPGGGLLGTAVDAIARDGDGGGATTAGRNRDAASGTAKSTGAGALLKIEEEQLDKLEDIHTALQQGGGAGGGGGGGGLLGGLGLARFAAGGGGMGMAGMIGAGGLFQALGGLTGDKQRQALNEKMPGIGGDAVEGYTRLTKMSGIMGPGFQIDAWQQTIEDLQNFDWPSLPSASDLVPDDWNLPAPGDLVPDNWSLPSPGDLVPDNWSLPSPQSLIPNDWGLPSPSSLVPEDWSLPNPSVLVPEDWALPSSGDLVPEDWGFPSPGDLVPEDWNLPQPGDFVPDEWNLPSPGALVPDNWDLPNPSALVPEDWNLPGPEDLPKIQVKRPDWLNNLPGVTKGGDENGMAAGGVVTGPTRQLLGEGREDEAVMPLSALQSTIQGAAAQGARAAGGDTRGRRQRNPFQVESGSRTSNTPDQPTRVEAQVQVNEVSVSLQPDSLRTAFRDGIDQLEREVERRVEPQIQQEMESY
jgi:hypothetical protein